MQDVGEEMAVGALVNQERLPDSFIVEFRQLRVGDVGGALQHSQDVIAAGQDRHRKGEQVDPGPEGEEVLAQALEVTCDPHVEDDEEQAADRAVDRPIRYALRALLSSEQDHHAPDGDGARDQEESGNRGAECRAHGVCRTPAFRPYDFWLRSVPTGPSCMSLIVIPRWLMNFSFLISNNGPRP